MLQLLHLRLTRPAWSRDAFLRWRAKSIEFQRHRRSSPEGRLADEVTLATFGDHPRRRPITPETIEAVDPEKAFAIWKDRFADFGGLTVVFVGSFDPARLRPLVETYLGSLPSARKPERWRDTGPRFSTKTVERVVSAGREDKSLVWLEFNAPARWTADAGRDARILRFVLALRLRDALRVQAAGTYDVKVNAWLNREPRQESFVNVSFACAPQNVDKLRQVVFDEMSALAANGIGDAYLMKVSEGLRRDHEAEVKDNEWWIDQLKDAYYFGDDFARANDLDALTARVSSANVAATARRMLAGKPHVQVVVRPEARPSSDDAAKGSRSER